MLNYDNYADDDDNNRNNINNNINDNSDNNILFGSRPCPSNCAHLTPCYDPG